MRNSFEQLPSAEEKLALFREAIEGLKLEEDFPDDGIRKTAHFQGEFDKNALTAAELELWEGFQAVMADERRLESFLPSLNAYRDNLKNLTDDQARKAKGMILSYLTNKLAEKQLRSELNDLEK